MLTRLSLVMMLFLSVVLSVESLGTGASPLRFPSETVEQAYQRNKPGINNPESAYDKKAPLSKWTVKGVVEYPDYTSLLNDFENVRDERFLQVDSDPDFLRRISWLLPDDGCYARAHFVNSKLSEWGKIPLPKIFAFGALTVKTPNAFGGSVSWWYHVANIARVGSQLYVMDPAIEPVYPLTVETWIRTMNAFSDVQVSICNDETYDPYYNCTSPFPVSHEEALRSQLSFLPMEWSRMTELGRDPVEVLGDSPPWLE